MKPQQKLNRTGNPNGLEIVKEDQNDLLSQNSEEEFKDEDSKSNEDEEVARINMKANKGELKRRVLTEKVRTSTFSANS